MGLALARVLILITITALAVGGCAKRRAPGTGPLAADTAASHSTATSPHKTAGELSPGDLLASNGRTVTPLDLNEFSFLSSFSHNADYVLVGEGHTVACDHTVQTRIMSALTAAGREPIVGLEMVAEDYQHVLDGFNAGSLSLEELPEALDWGETWRFDFELYKPIFKLSRSPEMPPLYALNLPFRVVKDVSRLGIDNIAEEDGRYLPKTILPPPPAQEQALEEEFGRHQAMSGTSGATGAGKPEPRQSSASSKRFFLVQSLWDTKMAERAVTLRKRFKTPVIILAGAGHVEFGWGIAHRIKTLDPGAKIVTVMPWRGGPLPDPKQANAFYYCPQTHKSRLGFTLEWVTRPGDDSDDEPGHALILAVAEDSKAAKAGLQPDDTIIKAGEEPLEGLWTLHEQAIRAKKANKPLFLTIDRDDAELTVEIPIE